MCDDVRELWNGLSLRHISGFYFLTLKLPGEPQHVELGRCRDNDLTAPLRRFATRLFAAPPGDAVAEGDAPHTLRSVDALLVTPTRGQRATVAAGYSTPDRPSDALAAERRAAHSTIIAALAALVRLSPPERLPEKWGELIDRESVVQQVVRIRAAADKLNGAARIRKGGSE